MEAFVSATVTLGTPLLLAALAGIVAERTGVLNIGLEGFMLAGAFMAGWGAGGQGPVAVGLMAAVIAGVALGTVFGSIVVRLRADQVAVGIAFNILVLGATTYGAGIITSDRGFEALGTSRGGTVAVPVLDSVPWLGPIFQQHWLTYVAYLLVPIAFVMLYRTGLGARARACGEYSLGAQAVGIDVARWRIGATALSGLLASAAGSYLVLADANQFVSGMSAGKGYIALALVILARWNPLGAAAAAAFFGAVQAFDFVAQGGVFGLEPPGELIQTIPYVFTIVAVTVVGRRVQPPAEDGKPLMLSGR